MIPTPARTIIGDISFHSLSSSVFGGMATARYSTGPNDREAT
jgi:hypothetical protein